VVPDLGDRDHGCLPVVGDVGDLEVVGVNLSFGKILEVIVAWC